MRMRYETYNIDIQQLKVNVCLREQVQYVHRIENMYVDSVDGEIYGHEIVSIWSRDSDTITKSYNKVPFYSTKHLFLSPTTSC